mmetsp:Transcript_27881/g.70061  ORF Transcript_27881/g.70061 Transcript_27881/m.70061 type:complete len:277 (+) Transcript_27881:140-970(+)
MTTCGPSFDTGGAPKRTSYGTRTEPHSPACHAQAISGPGAWLAPGPSQLVGDRQPRDRLHREALRLHDLVAQRGGRSLRHDVRERAEEGQPHDVVKGQPKRKQRELVAPEELLALGVRHHAEQVRRDQQVRQHPPAAVQLRGAEGQWGYGRRQAEARHHERVRSGQSLPQKQEIRHGGCQHPHDWSAAPQPDAEAHQHDGECLVRLHVQQQPAQEAGVRVRRLRFGFWQGLQLRQLRAHIWIDRLERLKEALCERLAVHCAEHLHHQERCQVDRLR